MKYCTHLYDANVIKTAQMKFLLFQNIPMKQSSTGVLPFNLQFKYSYFTLSDKHVGLAKTIL